ncbi:MAG: DUF6364 family protein [Candidatus Xenobiia bacterium LiM19]
MERQNITLSIPKKLLRHAKHIALEKGTSLSGLLTRMLEELALREDIYDMARKSHIPLMENFDLGTGGTIALKREELHERSE